LVTLICASLQNYIGTCYFTWIMSTFLLESILSL
jgi:hypothetical protein